MIDIWTWRKNFLELVAERNKRGRWKWMPTEKRARAFIREHAPDVDPSEAQVVFKASSEPPELIEASAEDREKVLGWSIQYVSTPAVDRDREILVSKGVSLKEYRAANMPVFWGHQTWNPPIGKDEWIVVDDRGVKSRTRYIKGDPMAETVFRGMQFGAIRSHSVGFLPLEIIRPGTDGWTETIRSLRRGGHPGLTDEVVATLRGVVKRWILLEHSPVGVASNPEALTEGVSKGRLDPDCLRRLGFDELPIKDGGGPIPPADDDELDDIDDGDDFNVPPPAPSKPTVRRVIEPPARRVINVRREVPDQGLTQQQARELLSDEIEKRLGRA